jgi:6-phosphogluconolactonase
VDSKIKIFLTPNDLAEDFAGKLVGMINDSAANKKSLTIALSGGSTPELLFTILGDKYQKSVHWKYVHFFWGDERCVPPENAESNYGMVKRTLFDKIDIPSSNIHRIRGESDPEHEALRYSSEIFDNTVKKEGFPAFDLVILGLGDDGHTASIFPGHNELFQSDKICEVAVHPVTGQKRITLTGRVINNAESVAFLVTGRKKGDIVEKLLKKQGSTGNFPASYIVPVHGSLHWYIDKEAGTLLRAD